ncbi:hypothetical protein ACTLKO_004628 [Enterobacter ludwigii]|uniref:hypothetical protein n=1 Tax=Enterobacter TaxID=547 RepID=UPI000798B682|nr:MULTISPECIES: hypothetical protein [Enterobacter]MBG0636291.1 hypothetical protein [Enterobacter ludwigii]MBX8882081.1 hypothetical protein [Enterobacter ludwigii]MCK7237571.1 hypothetical protein [Enterobacter bugandensis]MDW5478501.1 hypothetical protein [Enterobacter ludwigii]WLK83004.1 hypothetical protein Q8W08_23245 [Enterobacter ludwigii]
MLTFQTENLSDSSPDELRLFQNITRFRKARSSWDDFENLIHELLINASASMSESRNHLKYESTSEDGYSAVLFYILSGYKSYGLNVSREANNGGHCDISIELGKYKWLGEAKKAKDYQWVFDGFQQLTTRYSVSGANSKSGGLILYCNQKKVNSFMSNWMIELKSRFPAISKEECLNDDHNIKVTTHTHDVSGNEYKVIHIPIYLNYSPKK